MAPLNAEDIIPLQLYISELVILPMIILQNQYTIPSICYHFLVLFSYALTNETSFGVHQNVAAVMFYSRIILPYETIIINFFPTRSGELGC